jgi:hypothetical protein
MPLPEARPAYQACLATMPLQCASRDPPNTNTWASYRDYTTMSWKLGVLPTLPFVAGAAALVTSAAYVLPPDELPADEARARAQPMLAS